MDSSHKVLMSGHKNNKHIYIQLDKIDLKNDGVPSEFI